VRDINVKSIDGLRIAARDYGGNGPDVVLLHGATRNLEDWGSVLPHLTNMRIVTMDQRFHGLSDIGPPSTSEDWVRDIEALVDQAELSNPYVVGHSLGGVNALMYGAAHPDCPGVVDIDGYDVRQPELYDELPPDRVKEFLDGFASMSASFVPEDEGDDAWHTQQVAMAEQMDRTWGVEPAVTKKVLDRAFARVSDGRWQRRPPGSFWAPHLADGLSVDALDVLRRTSCRALVVLCTSDAQAFGPPEFFQARKRGVVRHFQTIADGKPNVGIETIDATHGVIHEQPVEVAKLVTSFVSS
jgi:pimeloyl-ACP methyl ester carboxylesterase